MGEKLLAKLARYFGIRIWVSSKRAAMYRALGEPEDTFQEEPCKPLEFPFNRLWHLGQRGCIWAVSKRADVRPAVWRASSNGVPALGIHPSGWSVLDSDVGDDGIFDVVEKFPYSDHCSFYELVQFLSVLPVAPVTFLTPLPSAGGKFGYDGEEGVQRLLELSGVPSLAYMVGGKRAIREGSSARASSQSSQHLSATNSTNSRRAIGGSSLRASSQSSQISAKPDTHNLSKGSTLSRSDSLGSCSVKVHAAGELPSGGKLERPVARPTGQICAGLQMQRPISRSDNNQAAGRDRSRSPNRG